MPLCPCGSQQDYSACCEPLHQGAAASNAEALMRSRFSAFVYQLQPYLKASWHPDTRPESLTLDDDVTWLQLQIHRSAERSDNTATVEFSAYFKDPQGWGVQSENSEFVCVNDHWLYHSGVPTLERLKPERNHPCPCGSGKKFKKCCLNK